MHVKLKKEEIQEGLSKIQNIVEKKSIMPVLSHFLMDVTDTGSFILATDLETAVKLPVLTETLEPGRACIPARKFYEIVKELDEEVELTLLDSWVKIQSGRSTVKLATLPPEEFPVWPEIKDATEIRLPRDLLLTAVEKTLYAAGEADARYVLNTLLFHLKPGELHVVGTDGHRLAHFKAEVEATQQTQMILSKKSLNELRKFLSDTETVSIHIGKTHVAFEMNGISFLTRLVEGNYPDYEVVIPRNNPNEAEVDRDSFIAALKRVSVLSKERQNAVKTEWNENLVIISSSDPELGEARDELPVDYQGEPITIGFNAKYLIDALEEITSEKAKITMSEPEKAVYITNVGVSSFVYECVVMPLRL